MNTNIFRDMSYGVYVVGTMDGDRPTGCIANSVMQITASPATVAVSMNHDNYSQQCIEKSGVFSFSILAEDSEPSIIGTFGFQSGRDTDKFQDISHEMEEGAPVVSDSCGYVVCKVIDRMETSTHTVFLGEVVDADTLGEGRRAMSYAYYHNVIKGKSPKNAPTYLQENEQESEDKQVSRYVCEVCGYIYEGESLPDDYICPVCKVGADKFKKVT